MASGTELVDLLDGVVDTLRATFTRDVVPTVVLHDGQVDMQVLKAYAHKAPACIVTFLGAPKVASLSGIAVPEVALAVFLVTKQEPGVSRLRRALLLLTRLLSVLVTTTWDLPFVKTAERIEATNLYDLKTDKTGLLLMAVRWRHRVELNELDDDGDPNQFLRAWADYSLTDGEVDASQSVDIRESEE